MCSHGGFDEVLVPTFIFPGYNGNPQIQQHFFLNSTNP